MSLERAAGMLVIRTEVEPMATKPGPAGTQEGSVHGPEPLPTIAAGWLLIRTVAAVPEMIASGRPGCGTGVGTGAGGWIGAWQCGESCLIMSPIRAAAGMGGS